MPAGARPGALELDLLRVAELIEYETDRRWADAGQSSLNIAFAKGGRRLSQDVVADAVLLTSPALSGSRDAVLEVLVGVREDLSEVGGPGPDAVPPIVPVALRLVEARVVGVLRLI